MKITPEVAHSEIEKKNTRIKENLLESMKYPLKPQINKEKALEVEASLEWGDG